MFAFPTIPSKRGQLFLLNEIWDWEGVSEGNSTCWLPDNLSWIPEPQNPRKSWTWHMSVVLALRQENILEAYGQLAWTVQNSAKQEILPQKQDGA